VAGIFAHAPNSAVNFTHVTGYVGNDGGSSQEQLDSTTPPSPNVEGRVITTPVNAVGLGLCNQGFGPFNGYANQIGEVYIGGGLVDIVFGGGIFAPAVNNGDPCQNGVVPPVFNGGARVLMANVPVNDTVQLDILYDYAHGYSFRGHSHPAGFITYSATDLSATPGTTVQDGFLAPAGLKFNEADAGAVADTATVNPLACNVPAADVKFSPDLLTTVAHLSLNGNVTGGHEIFGPAWGNSVGWNSFYVAATRNGGPCVQGNPAYLVPGTVKSDHIRIYVGQPTG